MLNIIAQTFPAADSNSPEVHKIYAVVAIIVVIGTAFTMVIAPMLQKVIVAMGLIKQTWKETMQKKVDATSAAVQANAQATATLIDANKALPGPNVDPGVEAAVKQTASVGPTPTNGSTA